MYCPSCGANVAEGTGFCPVCGTQMDQVPAGVQGAAAPSHGVSVLDAAPQGWSQPQPQPQFPQSQASQNMPPVPAAPFASKGCFSQALDDVLHTPGSFSRIVKMAILPGILALIPVVGWIAAVVMAFCVCGYAITWGREISHGRQLDLKMGSWNHRHFSLGLFSSVVTFVMQLPNIVIGLIAGTVIGLGTVGVVGAGALGALQYADQGYMDPNALAAGLGVYFVLFILMNVVMAVLGVLLGMFSDALVMHMAVTGRVEGAFDLGGVWRSMKGSLGKLFCASVLPGLLTGLIAVVCGLVFSVVGGLLTALLASLTQSFAVLSAMLSVMGILAAVLAIFIGAVLAAFALMLHYRALGYWAARYAPQWAHEE